MRLYLSSFGIGDAPEALVKLAPRGRMGLIANALDNFPDARRDWQASQSEALAQLGFQVQDVDLRDYFGASTKVASRLCELDALWVLGGNAFLLRRAMAQSGLDIALKTALNEDRIVYAGFSAAAVVLPKSLRGLDLVDNPHDVSTGYHPDVIWDGLDILPYSIVVHFDSDHPETEGAHKEASFYRENGIAYKTLKDGQALVIANGAPSIVPAEG